SVPWRLAFDAHRFGHVFEVLRYRDTFERRGPARHFEYVGKGVFPEVVPQLDRAFLVRIERADVRVVWHRHPPLRPPRRRSSGRMVSLRAARATEETRTLSAGNAEQLDLEQQGRAARNGAAAYRAIGEARRRGDLDRVAHTH